MRGATTRDQSSPWAAAFQLTHLLRGATQPILPGAEANKISTHAPLARCDVSTAGRESPIPYFNSRTSCEVRPESDSEPSCTGISTHAPLARCDFLYFSAPVTRTHFNSRTSCEVRPYRFYRRKLRFHFNSRTSCEVRRRTAAGRHDGP